MSTLEVCNMHNLIVNIIFSWILTFIGIVSMIYGIKRIPNGYGVWGQGCKDTKGAFIYNFFGMGGTFIGVFSAIYFVAMILRLFIYLLTGCQYMLIP